MNSDRTKILACDISPEAVMIAKRNVDNFFLKGRVSIFCGDLFAPFRELGCEEGIDLVVCNPPYIPTGSLCKLSKEILDHEPKIALDGGPFGIDFHRRLITDSFSMLKPKGGLIF
jgi:release factor glutamine methyltransferase